MNSVGVSPRKLSINNTLAADRFYTSNAGVQVTIEQRSLAASMKKDESSKRGATGVSVTEQNTC